MADRERMGGVARVQGAGARTPSFGSTAVSRGTERARRLDEERADESDSRVRPG